MKAETDSSSDKLLGVIKAGQSIIRTLYYLQLGLVVLSCSGLVVAVTLKLIGLYSELITPIAICSGLCGAGSWVVGRIAKPHHEKYNMIKTALRSSPDENNT